MESPVKTLMNMVDGVLQEFGGAVIFFIKIIRTWRSTGGYRRPVIQQIAEVSTRTMSTVIFAGVFVGAILVLQFDLMLRRFDAQALLGGLNTSATIREVGPLIISFLLAGKVGAYTTAELANMRVTEQIDAIESLGTDPIRYLIVPRFFGVILSSIILLAIGLSVSILGALLVAQTMSGMNLHQYLASIPHSQVPGPCSRVSFARSFSAPLWRPFPLTKGSPPVEGQEGSAKRLRSQQFTSTSTSFSEMPFPVRCWNGPMISPILSLE